MSFFVSVLLSSGLFIIGAIALYVFGRLSFQRIKLHLEEHAEGELLKGKIKSSASILLTLGAGYLLYMSVDLWNKNVSMSYDKLNADYKTAVDERDKAKKALDEANDRESTLKLDVANLKTNLISAAEAKRELESELAREADRRRLAEGAMKEALLLQDKLRLSPEQLKEYNGIVKQVTAINGLLNMIQLTETSWPVLTGRPAVARFAIERKDLDPKAGAVYGRGLFVFKAEEFTLRDQNGALIENDFKSIFAQNVCRAVELAIISRIRFIDALYQVAPAFERYMNDTTEAALAEAVMLQVVLKFQVARADVLFRGYADNTKSAWSHPLPASRTQVVAHRMEVGRGEMTFSGQPDRIPIGKMRNSQPVYDNDDLPNLRGDEVASTIDKLVPQCAFRDAGLQGQKAGIVNIGVLEGAPFDVFNKIERKAFGFLLISLDAP